MRLQYTPKYIGSDPIRIPARDAERMQAVDREPSADQGWRPSVCFLRPSCHFVRRRNALRCTPAIAAGFERDFWTVEQLVEATSIECSERRGGSIVSGSHPEPRRIVYCQRRQHNMLAA